MPIRVDASGRRSVQAEVEVPGTPEEVWAAIATGPGVSSWFVPTDVEMGDKGVPVKVVSHFGPGNSMDSVANVTAWNPPHRFSADSNDMGPSDPTVATEWIVEARAGGTCIVRVVHSWFASTDDWDNQFEGHEHGWRAFFRILRLYLSHFRGQPCTAFQLMAVAPEPAAAAWESLVGPLGLAGAAAGQRVKAASGAPVLAGFVEQAGEAAHPELLIRLDEPGPGLAHLFALPMGGQVYLPVRLYLYGPAASGIAERTGPTWQRWLAERFPPVGDPSPVGS